LHSPKAAAVDNTLRGYTIGLAPSCPVVVMVCGLVQGFIGENFFGSLPDDLIISLATTNMLRCMIQMKQMKVIHSIVLAGLYGATRTLIATVVVTESASMRRESR
jgi:hypothetical protein